MGFSSLIDILGSILIGGILLLILFRLNDTAVENSFIYNGDLIVQQNLTEVVSLLEYDFRRIGYCAEWENIPDPSKSIISADSNMISFLTDTDSDGDVDTLKYTVGSTNDLSVTPNPEDRMLFRVKNSEPLVGANLGITQFRLVYFDALGDTIDFPITIPSEIYTMQINLTVENTAAYDGKYSSAFWRQIRLAARNLNNR